MSGEDEQSKAAYNILRRVPPSNIKERLFDTIKLAPDLTDQLLQTVDIPLNVATDPSVNKQYIQCEFNRDMDSYRSPHSNTYYPKLPDGQPVPDRLRKIEVAANNAFNQYRHLYFQGGVCSVYLWELDTNAFGFGVFIKNDINTQLRSGEVIKGTIDCSDVIEVTEKGKSASYTLISSVLLNVNLDIGLKNPLTISGSTAARKAVNGNVADDMDHIVNIGKLVESNSASFRDTIENIYIGKMKQIVDLIANQDRQSQQDLMAEAMKAFANRGK